MDDEASEGGGPMRTVKWIVSFAVSILGLLIGGLLGWCYDEGEPVLIGCMAGWVFGLLAGTGVTGLLREGINKFESLVLPIFPYAFSEKQRLLTTGVKSWDLYMTVHRVQNVVNSEPTLNLFSSANTQYLFIEIQVGRVSSRNDYFSVQLNKPMRTCVQQNGVFEENFRANIHPTENTIRVKLYAQGIVNQTLLGVRDIKITDEVIDQGFPQNKVFNLMQNSAETRTTTDNLAGSCVISFAPGENVHPGTIASMEQTHGHAFDHMRTMLGMGTKNENAGDYHAWATGKNANYGTQAAMATAV